MICAGIDAGSRAIKVVLLKADNLEVVAAGAVDQGVEQEALALQLLQRLLGENGVARDDLHTVVATGYGRKLIRTADATITEITCQGWGVRHRVPEVRTVIDIGGQDSKFVRLSTDGAVEDFIMNDRCAAGTGRFLEVLATRLGVKLGCLGELAGKSRKPAIISNMCVVFAETEIVGLLASGTTAEDIVAGVQAAIATRVAAMAGRNAVAPIIFTGGVAMVPGMDAALESALGKPVAVAPQPQMTGALGAAVLAARRLDGRPTPAL
ncbi:MAG: acyl-CoA dehydratase activase [Planctomycetota bacterium]|jgi:predicted CoA-substrate-specific enzyme activase